LATGGTNLDPFLPAIIVSSRMDGAYRSGEL
jgi:hypothetical protein